MRPFYYWCSWLEFVWWAILPLNQVVKNTNFSLNGCYYSLYFVVEDWAHSLFWLQLFHYILTLMILSVLFPFNFAEEPAWHDVFIRRAVIAFFAFRLMFVITVNFIFIFIMIEPRWLRLRSLRCVFNLFYYSVKLNTFRP